MFFSIGRNVKRINMGRYADFCPICRTVTAHKISRFDTVRHVNFIPVDTEGMVSEQCCQSCGTRIYQAGEVLHEVSFDKRLTLEQLVERTHPTVYADYADRLHLESHLQSVDSETRGELIREPFTVLTGHVLMHPRSTPVGVIGLLVLAAIICTVLRELLGEGAGSVMVYVCVGVVVVYAVIRRLRGKNKVEPLVRALAPLKPTLQEIEDAIVHIEQCDGAMRSRFNAARICRAIQDTPVQHRADGSIEVRDDLIR